MFGSNTPVGDAFKKKLQKCSFTNIFCYSRSKYAENYFYCDMDKPREFNFERNIGESTIVSFAPIWKTSSFLTNLSKNKPEFLAKVKHILVCSSSSAITKKYSFNKFDQELSRNLIESENNLIQLCLKTKIKITIVQPSLIYGSSGNYADKNFSKIISIMRKLPFIFLPKNTGMRQPIGCKQLAEVFIKLIDNSEFDCYLKDSRLLVGGDEILSYREMLIKLRNSTNLNDKARNCIFISVPDKVFILLFTPLIFFSIKYYEAIMRIFSNLSSFTFQSKITKKREDLFPIKSIY